MQTFSYTITDESGIHARVSAKLVREIQKYNSSIIIEVNSHKVEEADVIALMKLDAKCGDTILVEVKGDKEIEETKSLKDYFYNNL